MNFDSMFPASWKVILHSRVVWLWAGLCALGSFFSTSIDTSSWERSVDIKFLALGILLCQLLLVKLFVNFAGFSGVLLTVSGIELGKMPTLKESWVLVKQKVWKFLAISTLSFLLVSAVVLPILIFALVIVPSSDLRIKVYQFLLVFGYSSVYLSGILMYFALLAHFIDHKGVFASIGQSIRVIAQNIPGSIGFIIILFLVNLLPMLLLSTLAHLLEGVSLTEIIGWPFMLGVFRATGKPIFNNGIYLLNSLTLPFLCSFATIVYLYFTGRSRLEEASAVEAA